MNKELLESAKIAAVTIAAIYDWLDKVEAAGGATTISGVASCNAMLISLSKNRPRIEKLVMEPLRKAMEAAEAQP